MTLTPLFVTTGLCLGLSVAVFMLREQMQSRVSRRSRVTGDHGPAALG